MADFLVIYQKYLSFLLRLERDNDNDNDNNDGDSNSSSQSPSRPMSPVNPHQFPPLCQVLSDYGHLRTNKQFDQQTFYQQMIDEKRFGADFKHCEISICVAVRRNGRNRNRNRNSRNSNMYCAMVTSEMITTTDALDVSAEISMMDAIHTQMMHAFDSGMKMTIEEQMEIEEATQQAQDTDDNNDNDLKLNVDTTIETGTNQLSTKFSNYVQLKADDGNESSSKFVSQAQEIQEEQVDEKENDNNSNQLQQQTPIIKKSIYSSGVRFQYWPYYKHKQPDNQWFIPKKFENIRDEMMFNSIYPLWCLRVFKETLKEALHWLRCDYCKKMNSNSKWVEEYGIRAGAVVLVGHLLSVLFYCNFSELCSEFSKTFRKIPANESDQHLIERHSNYWEWGRLLREMVEVYGVSFCDSDEEIFYHGISGDMLFESTYARFCAPTSTTTSFSVATNFASVHNRNGIILQLENDRNPRTFYFPCMVLSVHSNEEERLFIGGLTQIPFVGIQQLLSGGCTHSYQLLTKAMTTVQYMIKGECANFEITNKIQRCVRLLIDHQLHKCDPSVAASASPLPSPLPSPSPSQWPSTLKWNSKSNKKRKSKKKLKKAKCAKREVPQYIARQFDISVKKVHTVIIAIDQFNKRNTETKLDNKPKFHYYFLELREFFCELYSKHEIKQQTTWRTKHMKNFVNPIRTLNFKMIADLFPNMRSLTILYLPLTNEVIEGLRESFIFNHSNKKQVHPNIGEIVIKCERDIYMGQSEMTYGIFFL